MCGGKARVAEADRASGESGAGQDTPRRRTRLTGSAYDERQYALLYGPAADRRAMPTWGQSHQACGAERTSYGKVVDRA